jgi:hypothetical protein
VAVPDRDERDEVVLRIEVREVNLLVVRLVLLAAALAVLLPIGMVAWPY